MRLDTQVKLDTVPSNRYAHWSPAQKSSRWRLLICRLRFNFHLEFEAVPHRKKTEWLSRSGLTGSGVLQNRIEPDTDIKNGVLTRRTTVHEFQRHARITFR
jgi:hypothetical protein